MSGVEMAVAALVVALVWINGRLGGMVSEGGKHIASLQSHREWLERRADTTDAIMREVAQAIRSDDREALR